MDKDKGQAVVVCTDQRGVFFGYAPKPMVDRVIDLVGARNAFYWKCSTGIHELAESGPKAGSKIGGRADVTLTGVTMVAQCTPVAVDAWESARWGE